MQDLSALFSGLEDPRCGNAKRHDFLELLFIALCTVLSGGESCVDMALLARTRRDFLRHFIKMENGPPSHDTFSRLFRRLDPKGLQQCLLRFMKALGDEIGGEVIAIDGKTLRRSFDRAARQGALHLVLALACESRLVLGQLSGAVAQLLAMMRLGGAIVTADALHCQRDTAALIRRKGGDYVLACKGNQKGLLDDIRLFMADENVRTDVHEVTDAGHGRVEVRKVRVSHDVEWLRSHHDWPGLAAVACVERTREAGGKRTTSTCYYIMSRALPAVEVARVVRQHWAIENALHWILDVTYREDDQRARKDMAPQNLAALRRIALNLARLEPSRGSMRAKLKRAAWDPGYLQKLIAAAQNI